MKPIAMLLALCAMTGMLQAADSPFVGDWKLDTSRTKFTDQMKVTNVSGNTYAFDFGAGAETITVDGTDQAASDATTLSVAAEGPGSWKVIRKKDGRVLLTAIWNLSPDGGVLHDSFTFFGPGGDGSTLDYVYERTAGTSGFAGTWESTNVTTNAVFLLKIRPFAQDGLSLIYPSQQVTKNVNFDGKDYPKVGPNVSPGSVCSARRIDAHTLELTDKSNGTVLDTQHIQLASDRKTLTVTVHVAGHRAPSVLVFQRE